jgi:hypothetical protein
MCDLGVSEIEADVIKLYLNGSGRDRDGLHQRPQFAAVDSFLSNKKRCSLQVFSALWHALLSLPDYANQRP